MDKTFLTILIFIMVGLFGFLLKIDIKFDDLSPDQKHSLIIEQRNIAIAEAKANGDYRCCIDSGCTMCYMEPNQWNNYKAGTCACDDFIAKGEDPCPQCKRGLVIDNGSSCDILTEACEH